MKKIVGVLMFVSMAIIVWLFVKEQFKGVVLSKSENTLLSITYLVMGISIFIFARLNSLQKKKEEQNNQLSNKNKR
jgi:hypothetical protein